MKPSKLVIFHMFWSIPWSFHLYYSPCTINPAATETKRPNSPIFMSCHEHIQRMRCETLTAVMRCHKLITARFMGNRADSKLHHFKDRLNPTHDEMIVCTQLWLTPTRVQTLCHICIDFHRRMTFLWGTIRPVCKALTLCFSTYCPKDEPVDISADTTWKTSQGMSQQRILDTGLIFQLMKAHFKASLEYDTCAS